ncbi:MAG: hypothetical protein ABSF43_13505 [Rectinemataceae bacterium]|jgi:hypothetical protein
MKYYELQINAPFVVGSANNVVQQIENDLLAVVNHYNDESGPPCVIEDRGLSTETKYSRYIKNIVDKDNSLLGKVKELRRKYPEINFILLASDGNKY